MDLKAYQAQALLTDKVPRTSEDEAATALIVPMLGLAGETGQLLSEYKKHLRDGAAHRLFKDRVGEELGDLLWYIANVASKFGLDLDQIAEKNLDKVRARFAPSSAQAPQRDSEFPDLERLPRQMIVRLAEEHETGPRPKVRMTINGEGIGSLLGDNAYDPDGYRFHDVFHLAYAAVLGWSPNLRAFLKRKRKSRPLLDEVEDGGRARIIEEGVSALAFDYARVHSFLDGVSEIDYGLLRTIQSMTSHLEVGGATAADWERAILEGFAVWRQVLANNGGEISVDLDARTISYLGTI
ncbi:nucleoside triphosphate pyrophosphohydrolase family protein [Sphingomonas sp. 2R-10]|uniref:nucleoside triphosphate pyrophosphohydrolase family protein n=1 Tax=Sphingomonas sp. 2R-10 TaxID=3045148 RepID=UPI000F770EA8|nr:nucleoside triphosphate pyrophosphohydrolase family protein [Sphingomonas sp. 2R-10]MDJ0277328.1 nucleoside triphosphate pyrophosphohydrolase family protein [Sphingomonas sp. 2R-10]